jgi:hypothetical protein
MRDGLELELPKIMATGKFKIRWLDIRGPEVR